MQARPCSIQKRRVSSPGVGGGRGGPAPAGRRPYAAPFLSVGARFEGAGVPPGAVRVVVDEDEFVPPAPAAARDAQDEDVDLYRELNNS